MNMFMHLEEKHQKRRWKNIGARETRFGAKSRSGADIENPEVGISLKERRQE
jgi:hypothetical protein